MFVDIHEDGRYVIRGRARGRNRQRRGAGQQAQCRVVFQCGADGLKGRPPGTPELHAGRARACEEKPARHRHGVCRRNVDGFRRRLQPRQSCEGLERSTAGNQLTTCQGASANAVTVPISDASERHELGSVVAMYIVLVGSGPQSHWTIFPPLVTAPVRAISGQGRRMMP